MRFLISAAFLTVGFSLTAAQDSPAATLLQAKQLYYSGIAGNPSDLAQSAALFDHLSPAADRPSIHPPSITDPSIAAYRGSLLLIEAGQTLALWKKSDLSRRGLTLLDDSVAAHPEDLEIRFVRAATTLHLPIFFRRKSQSCEDFRFLAPKAAEAANRRQLDPRIAAGALFFYAKNCASNSVLPADSAMRQAASIAPDSPAGHAAAAQLAQHPPLAR
jgi:hypothetical protein